MQPGAQLGHDSILSAIGKGGMGEVWKAKDTKLGRRAAIKTMELSFLLTILQPSRTLTTITLR